MQRELKEKLAKYGITVGIGLALSIFYVAVRDFGAQPLVDKYRILCDAFTVPGALLLFAALLMSISNTGALDGVGYVLRQGLSMLIPGKGLGSERYIDYVENKRKNKKTGFGFLYICAAGFMLVAMVFLVLFYTVFGK